MLDKTFRWTVKQAAEILTAQHGHVCSVHAVRKWRAKNCGPAARFDPIARRWLYSDASLEAFALQRAAALTTGLVDQPAHLARAHGAA